MDRAKATDVHEKNTGVHEKNSRNHAQTAGHKEEIRRKRKKKAKNA